MGTAWIEAPAQTPIDGMTIPGATTYQDSQESMVDVLTCRIGEQQYGVPVSAVREVVRLPALLSLAGAPACCCGLLNIRGTYVPVIDGRVLLEMSPHYDVSSQIIILGQGQPEAGLLVDEVCDVRLLTVNRSTLYQLDTAAKVLRGVVSSGDSTIILFDVDVLRTMAPAGLAPA